MFTLRFKGKHFHIDRQGFQEINLRSRLFFLMGGGSGATHLSPLPPLMMLVSSLGQCFSLSEKGLKLSDWGVSHLQATQTSKHTHTNSFFRH